jgi:transcriptional regulator with XRE-family HTH domain
MKQLSIIAAEAARSQREPDKLAIELFLKGDAPVSGYTVRRVREFLGCSQTEFAEALGLRRQKTIADMEAGRKDGLTYGVSDTLAQLMRCLVVMAQLTADVDTPPDIERKLRAVMPRVLK